jgi:hypothetical protein
MTRENMLTMLREMGKSTCTEGECEVDTLQNIGADYGITGNIVQIEGTYLITLKFFDSRQGALLGTVKVEAETKRKLIADVETAAARLTTEALKSRAAAATAAPAPTPAPAPAAAAPVAPVAATAAPATKAACRPLERAECEKFCASDSAQSCGSLGNLYETGRDGSPVDRARAIKTYTRGCELVDAYSCDRLGVLVGHGLAGPTDVNRAFTLYKRACDAGSGTGCTHLASAYRRGVGTTASNPSAVAALRRACELDVDECEDSGIDLAKLGAHAFAEAAWHRACEAEYTDSCWLLHKSLRAGKSGAPDDAKARAVAQTACDFGLKWGCTAVER